MTRAALRGNPFLVGINLNIFTAFTASTTFSFPGLSFAVDDSFGSSYDLRSSLFGEDEIFS